jgi:hypothetical protein
VRSGGGGVAAYARRSNQVRPEVAKNKVGGRLVLCCTRIPTSTPQPRAVIHTTIRHVHYNHARLSLPSPRCRNRIQWYEVACTPLLTRDQFALTAGCTTTSDGSHHLRLPSVGEYLSAIRDAVQNNAPPTSPHAVMDQRCSHTLRLPTRSLERAYSPGSLTLMTSTGRPVARSYWLGVQAEPAHRREAKLCYWQPCADGVCVHAARPVGLRCLT